MTAAAAKWRRRDETERLLKLSLQTLLARADSERDIILAVIDAIRKIFPGAVGVAAGAFSDELCTRTSLVEGCATSLSGQLALLSTIPEDVGVFNEGPGARQTSVWHACDRVASYDGDGRATDSRDATEGIQRFTDWSEARRLGLETNRAVTATISAEDVILGFVVVHLPTKRRSDQQPEAVRILMDVCQIVGSALFVRRALVGVGVNTKGAVEGAGQEALLSAAAAAGIDNAAVAAGDNGSADAASPGAAAGSALAVAALRMSALSGKRTRASSLGYGGRSSASAVGNPLEHPCEETGVNLSILSGAAPGTPASVRRTRPLPLNLAPLRSLLLQ